MPYRGGLSIRELLSYYRLDPELGSPENHIAELRGLFQRNPNATPSRIRKVLGDHLVRPDRFFRSSDEQREASQLTQKLQEKLINKIVSNAVAIDECEKLPTYSAAVSLIGRGGNFYRTDLNDPDTMKFNEQFIQAHLQWKEDPTILQNLIFGEINALQEKLGLNTPEGIQKLATLTDAELVEKFEDITRYQQLLLQAADSDTAKYLTEEQKADLFARYNQMEFLQNFEIRYNAIANPYYADINFDLLYEQNIRGTDFYESMTEQIPGISDGNSKQNTLNILFATAEGNYPLIPRGLPAYISALKPELADQLKDELAKVSLIAALSNGVPYMLASPDGEQYVIPNKARLDKIPTAQEYSEDLLAAAVKADKWLLTGSKQFDTMMRAQKALNEARDEGVSAEKLKELAENLEKAAKDYLTYKDSGFKEYTGPSSVHGKNMREQSRLEAAGNILNYAKAQIEASPKLIEMEAAAKLAAQKKEEALKQGEDVLRNTFEKNTGSLNFLNNLPAATTAALPREVPTVETKQKVKIDDALIERMVETPLVPQDQFSALCALACGSGKVHTTTLRTKKVNNEYVYKDQTSVKKDKDGNLITVTERVKVREKVENPNLDPVGTFKAAMEAIVKGPDVLKDSPAKTMITAAQSNVAHALKDGKKDGKYDELGKMVADGLKTNNDLMKEQMGFTSTFSAGANLINQALQAMNKNPALRDAVEKNLDPNQLQIAKGIKALSDMRADGLQAQLDVLNHLRLPNKNLDDPTFRENVAKVCSMYGMSTQFAGKKVDLVNLANDPQYPKNITSALANNQAVTNFIEDLKTKSMNEQFKAISTPKEMSKLFQTAAENAKQQADLQNQPLLQFHLQAAPLQAAQPQPQPQQQMPM